MPHMGGATQHTEGRKPEAIAYEMNQLPGVRVIVRADEVARKTKTRKTDAATIRKESKPTQVDSANKESTQPDSTNKESTQADSTNKEIRRMSRAELIEVIYALEQDNVSLQKENKKLRDELDDKDIRIETSGSIAEAALSLNHIFEDAQAAADQYLDSIKHNLNSAEETIP